MELEAELLTVQFILNKNNENYLLLNTKEATDSSGRWFGLVLTERSPVLRNKLL